jgi:hypothetical protein
MSALKEKKHEAEIVATVVMYVEGDEGRRSSARHQRHLTRPENRGWSLRIVVE